MGADHLAEVLFALRPDRIAGRQLVGRVRFFLRVSDFDDSYRWMRAAGAEFVTAPRTEAYGWGAVFSGIAGNRWNMVRPVLGS